MFGFSGYTGLRVADSGTLPHQRTQPGSFVLTQPQAQLGQNMAGGSRKMSPRTTIGTVDKWDVAPHCALDPQKNGQPGPQHAPSDIFCKCPQHTVFPLRSALRRVVRVLRGWAHVAVVGSTNTSGGPGWFGTVVQSSELSSLPRRRVSPFSQTVGFRRMVTLKGVTASLSWVPLAKHNCLVRMASLPG